ncbi:MAG TPA: AMP-dependent synthetase, partial [Alphaproteobacteria bacterium]|nr:AMP-dependent synthetase [Alphaproteobacteria bacterium]
MSFYNRLVKETEDQRQELYSVPQLMDGIQGNISKETYIAYLTEAYHHVSHTVPFLMTMGSKIPQSKKWMHKAIIEYQGEEVGHEEWILNDIESAGGDKEAAHNSAPNLE